MLRSFFLFIILLIAFGAYTLRAQTVYQDIQKVSIYLFLDEMSNLHLIELNTLIKPYSRNLIAQKLIDIDTVKLNQRQKLDLQFFLKEYGKDFLRKDFKERRKDLFFYSDSVFTITANPIAGGTYWTNNKGSNWHRWWGGEFWGYIGTKWGFYGSLRDQREDEQWLSESYLTNRTGAVYKSSGDFSDFRGGITYSGKNASLGLIKDLFNWGNHQFGSNIFSDRSPTFTRLNFDYQITDWLSINYFHGWLNSEQLDSTRSYQSGNRFRQVLVNKYLAANIISIRPVKKLYVSIGNSIVYSDNFHPAFLIPFGFFKSIDHAVYAGGGNDGGQNTQLFLDISSRNIKNFHFYTSLFIDEISFSRFWDSDQHSNFISAKLGAQMSNLANRNLTLTAEFNFTNPMTYRHFINSTTFSTNNYTLGHYLGDNALNLAFQLDYQPMARLRCSAGINLASKGNTYGYTQDGRDVWGLPFQEDIEWRNNQYFAAFNYEVLNDLNFSLQYHYREQSGNLSQLYSPQLLQGNSHTITTQVNLGF